MKNLVLDMRISFGSAAITIPQFEFFSERQIEKALEYAHKLLKVTPSLIILLILWIVFCIFAMVYKCSLKSRSTAKSPKVFACILYFFTIFHFCVLNREKESSSSIILVPSKWVQNGWLHESMLIAALLNLCIFVPFGILLYQATRKGLKSELVVLAAALAVETTQYVTKRGLFKTIDISMYLLGGMLGIFLAWIVWRLSVRRQRRRASKRKLYEEG